MKLVIIESPYAGNWFIRRRNIKYARRCMKDSLDRGEAPFASHLLYTQVLDDNDLLQRDIGIDTGLAWGEKAELTAVYGDYGYSYGMRIGIRHARFAHRPVEYRNIGKNPSWLQKLFGKK